MFPTIEEFNRLQRALEEVEESKEHYWLGFRRRLGLVSEFIFEHCGFPLLVPDDQSFLVSKDTKPDFISKRGKVVSQPDFIDTRYWQIKSPRGVEYLCRGMANNKYKFLLGFAVSYRTAIEHIDLDVPITEGEIRPSTDAKGCLALARRICEIEWHGRELSDYFRG
jgi:hypothetical protein